MKEFNLEEAINGKAFYLKNGYRGVIKYCVDDILTSEDRTPRFAYIGYVLDNRGFLNLSKAAWDENGITNEPRSYDAVGMVEDMLEQNTEEKMKMKPFDLKAALNGEPVMLRNERKAFVMYDLRNHPDLMDKLGRKPLSGIVFNKDESIYTNIEWNEFGANALVQYDIIGMWEEPKISVEDLPKPFEPKLGEYYYRITSRSFYDILDIREKEYTDPEYDDKTVNQGNAFRTREDAQKWLDFMKSMME